MNGRVVKEQLYEHFARIGKSLSSPQRLVMLDLLSQGEMPVEYIAQEARLSFANASRHLQILRNARLVVTRKEGTRVYYRLASTETCTFFRNLRNLAKNHLAEVNDLVENYFRQRDQMEKINSKELLSRARKGNIVILDVRPKEEYESAHIKYAKTIPLKELIFRIQELPKDVEIVAYCRGPYCVLAQEAVNLLQSMDYNAIRLEDGIYEWQEKGLPVISKQ